MGATRNTTSCSASTYAAAVRAELSRGGYLTVLPGSDAASMALGRPEARFMNKLQAAELAGEVGLRVPPSRVFDSYEDLRGAASELPYPAIVKPETKRFLAQRVERPEDLARVPDGPGRLIVQPFLSDDLHGLLGLMWQGRLVAATHFRYLRLWPLPAGTVAAAVTTAPDPDLEGQVAHVLAGYDGLFHADLAGPYLLDLNPRIHATMPGLVDRFRASPGAHMDDVQAAAGGLRDRNRLLDRPPLGLGWP